MRAVEVLQKELAGLRTGRAAVSLLEPVTVDAYGAAHAAAAGGDDRRPGTAAADRSGVGSRPGQGGRAGNPGGRSGPQSGRAKGRLIRMPIPALNEQRRVEITKIAVRYAEEARVAVRNVRRHAMDELKKAEKDGGISQDQVPRLGQADPGSDRSAHP